VIAIGSVIFAPLCPIFIEMGFKSTVSQGSLLISAIMYVAALAFSTDRKVIFWAGSIAVAYLCIVYGAEMRDLTTPEISILNKSRSLDLTGFDYGTSRPVYSSAIILMVCFGVAHLLQRWKMHIIEAQPFLEFRVSTAKTTKGNGL
jgi:hypothetical protein